MKRSLLFFLALALALPVGNLASATDHGPTGRHPSAPPETEQFAFIIGDWECTQRTMSRDGKLGEPSKARWTGHWELDGWAIRDDWSKTLPDGSAFKGFNIRSFNPRTGKWDNRWLQTGNLEWKYFEAERVGETMVMTGEGEDRSGKFIDRNTFHDITADSWSWRKDRSYDGGETWIEGIAVIDAVRAK